MTTITESLQQRQEAAKAAFVHALWESEQPDFDTLVNLVVLEGLDPSEADRLIRRHSALAPARALVNELPKRQKAYDVANRKLQDEGAKLRQQIEDLENRIATLAIAAEEAKDLLLEAESAASNLRGAELAGDAPGTDLSERARQEQGERERAAELSRAFQAACIRAKQRRAMIEGATSRLQYLLDNGMQGLNGASRDSLQEDIRHGEQQLLDDIERIRQTGKAAAVDPARVEREIDQTKAAG